MTNYTYRNEFAGNRARRAFTIAVFFIVFALGLFLGKTLLFKRIETISPVQTPVTIPSAETTQNISPESTVIQQNVTAVPDFEVDDSMVAWGDAYSTVFRQVGSGDITTGIDGKSYDYALIPNRQELTLNVSDAKGYLKGTFVLSKFNKSDSYFHEIEIEIYDTGASDPFFVSTMDSDTRDPIDLCVKLSGHEKITIAFGYAGGDVYLVTNGLYISETR